VKQDKQKQLPLALALFLALLAGKTSAGFFGPPPEVMEKIRFAQKACNVELEGDSGPRALMKLKTRSTEDNSQISKQCQSALDAMPLPPQ
jgi:hypothetical protein